MLFKAELFKVIRSASLVIIAGRPAWPDSDFTLKKDTAVRLVLSDKQNSLLVFPPQEVTVDRKGEFSPIDEAGNPHWCIAYVKKPITEHDLTA